MKQGGSSRRSISSCPCGEWAISSSRLVRRLGFSCRQGISSRPRRPVSSSVRPSVPPPWFSCRSRWCRRRLILSSTASKQETGGTGRPRGVGGGVFFFQAAEKRRGRDAIPSGGVSPFRRGGNDTGGQASCPHHSHGGIPSVPRLIHIPISKRKPGKQASGKGRTVSTIVSRTDKRGQASKTRTKGEGAHTISRHTGLIHQSPRSPDKHKRDARTRRRER